MIKHISFDVWNTLIKPNPAFAAARTEYLANVADRDPDVVKATYTRIKKHVDDMAEKTGHAYTTAQVFDMLFAELELVSSEFMREAVRLDLGDRFICNPPQIPDSVKHLVSVLHRKGITLSIASNSNFISGRLMYPWLQQQFEGRFAFGVFSDLQGVAKPSAAFFGFVIDHLRRLNHRVPIRVNEVLHVGDNAVCDAWGADEVGMHGLLVESPDQLYDVVYPYLISSDNCV